MTTGLATFTLIHVLLSLIGIGSGLVVTYGFLRGRNSEPWNVLFLASTGATSLTGFGFPFLRFLPAHAVGIVTLVALAVALQARYGRQLAGAWGTVFVLACVSAFYLNCLIAIAQAFRRVPFLNALAPTQTELPFFVVELLFLGAFAPVGLAAVKRARVSAQPIGGAVRAR